MKVYNFGFGLVLVRQIISYFDKVLSVNEYIFHTLGIK
jgi:hypothetical protein